ncbi:MAG: enoyl-CoA hydratase/isomerase family protein [Deltaproteobacteria bacterium]|nr:enoyl-CoA hydratase/isomerase family protein [Deltaproteobacteria bacterium]MBW2360136.1 enoyl-CoA hydratase/isomerase family protein [Deltaproteobacteria bacterium]
MPHALIQVEREGDVATVTFNDPDRLNAMTEAMGRAFAEETRQLAGDASLRAVVLTGAGRAFSAGGDLDWIEAQADAARSASGEARADIRKYMRSFYGLFLSLRELPCPTIAAVNGHAVGAGLCVALACDMRLASRQARLRLNFSLLGLHPGMGATWTLPRLVGPAHAAELLYSGRSLDGEEAARIGLVNRALEPDAVVPEARKLAAAIAGAAPLANRGIKRALAQSAGATLTEQLDFEASEQARCFESEDVREGLAALREHRRPGFRGR